MDIQLPHRFLVSYACLIFSFLILSFGLSSTLHADSNSEVPFSIIDRKTSVSGDNHQIEETNSDESEKIIEEPPFDNTNESFTFPEAENIYVNDYAGLLDSNSIDKIIEQLIQLKSDHNIEMTIITIDSMNSYNAGPMIEPFATSLFNHWGVGDAQKNNGIMVLVSHSDRKMRIEIGRGYGSEWDSVMKEVIDDEFIPFFKNNDYQRGILNGVTETIKAVSGSDYSIFSIKDSADQLWNKLGYWWFAIIVPTGFGILIRVRNIIRRRKKNCHRCNHPMTLLDEDTDDLHLDGGQRLEEYLSSVDYYVRHCPQCEHIEIDRYKAWLKTAGACPKCQYVTLESESEIITRATTSSTGLKRVDYDCRHCGYHDSETVTIAKESESSSSSSGSSFGGGSSSGGGASGSW